MAGTLYRENELLLGKYRILRFLGRGAFAEVYLVEHLRLKVERAVKVLRRDTPGISNREMEGYRERFQVEAQIGAHLNSPEAHPNLLQVYDLPLEQEGALVLEMEYAPGGNLASRILEAQRAGKRLTIEEVVQVAVDIAHALEALHQRSIIHRDVKPSNILFTADGRAKLGDLGLAQTPESRVARLSQGSLGFTHPGTYEYMPPEQRPPYVAPLKPGADVYALGSTLFEVLTGRLYYQVRPGTRLKNLRPEAPEWLDELVMRMLAENLESRPWDGAEVAREVEQQRRLRSKPEVQMEIDAQQYTQPGEDQKQKMDALADFTRMIEQDPRNAIAYNGRGFVYFELLEWDKALADYNRAIELDAKYASAYINRGDLFYMVDEQWKAQADFSRAIELDPPNADTYILRGRVNNDLGKQDKALADYTRAIELDPLNADSYQLRGNIYFDLRERQKALMDYTRVVELDPKDNIALYSRGNVYYVQGEMEKALADFNRAIDLVPNYAIAYMRRGNVYSALEERDKALADYTRAIELNPNFAKTFYDRGLLHQEMGEKAKAIADFRKSWEINKYPDAKARLKELGVIVEGR